METSKTGKKIELPSQKLDLRKHTPHFISHRKIIMQIQRTEISTP